MVISALANLLGRFIAHETLLPFTGKNVSHEDLNDSQDALAAKIVLNLSAESINTIIQDQDFRRYDAGERQESQQRHLGFNWADNDKRDVILAWHVLTSEAYDATSDIRGGNVPSSWEDVNW